MHVSLGTDVRAGGTLTSRFISVLTSLSWCQVPQKKKLISPSPLPKKKCTCEFHMHGGLARLLQATPGKTKTVNQVLVCSWNFSLVYVQKKGEEGGAMEKKNVLLLLCIVIYFSFENGSGRDEKEKSAWNSGRQLTASECQMKSFSVLNCGGEECHQHSWW